MKNIEILHEDDFSIVINKPAGLAVQGGKGIKTSLDKLLAEIRNPPPLLVHRLDMDTSGVLLAAKSREVAASFSHFFSYRKVVNMYIAVCKSCPQKTEGVITEDINVHGSLKKSETRYKVLKSSNSLQIDNENIVKQIDCDYSILEIELGTGRMHQIRKHLAAIGNPVLGDDKYGDFTLNKSLKKNAGLKHLLLHASRLIIKDKYNLDISAPLPKYFKPYDIINNNFN